MTHDPAEKSKPTAPHRASPLPRPTRLAGITPRPGPSNVENPGTIKTNHHRTDTVNAPQILCPNCRTEIKLTESLAAPLLAETRKQFEAQLAAKETDFGRREARPRQRKPVWRWPMILASATGSLLTCSRCSPRTMQSLPKPSKRRPICCASSVSSRTRSAKLS
jgi:hypothetical protein